MPSAKHQELRDELLALRQRVTSGVDHVVEAIQEDVNPAGGQSGVPVHLADRATESMDADVYVLDMEQGMLREIDAALGRFDAGTFGICEECGLEIAEDRLNALPYAAVCIKCARAAG